MRCCGSWRSGGQRGGRELLARTKQGRQGAGCGWHGTARLGTAAVSPCTTRTGQHQVVARLSPGKVSSVLAFCLWVLDTTNLKT